MIERPLSIFVIGQASLNDMHGGATRLKTMVNLLSESGFKLTLITYSFYSNTFSIKRESHGNSLESITICVPDKLPKFLKALSIIPVFIISWSYAKECNLIFANFRFILSSVPAVFFSQIFNKPLVLDYLDIDPSIPDGIYRYISCRSDAVFTISNHLVNKAKSYGAKNVLYMPNFVNTNLFKLNYGNRTIIRDQLGIKSDEVVIAYAGAFTYWEGIPILITAFSELLKSYPELKLAIMGKIHSTGKDDNIQSIINQAGLINNTILIPSQQYEDVPRFLSAFDILCCPKTDCEINRLIIPIKIIEYMSMGLPTVSSSVGGIPEIIEDKIDGFLVKPGDVGDLKEKLEWIIENMSEARKIGEKGRSKILNYYSHPCIKEKVNSEIEKVINNHYA